MKNKPDPRAQLFSDAFQEDWADGPMHAFALRAAAAARRRRLRQQFGAGGAIVALVVTILFSAKSMIESSPARVAAPFAHAAKTTAADTTASITAEPAYEIISDDELIAALRGRPMLILPDAPNGPRVVVLSR